MSVSSQAEAAVRKADIATRVSISECYWLSNVRASGWGVADNDVHGLTVFVWLCGSSSSVVVLHPTVRPFVRPCVRACVRVQEDLHATVVVSESFWMMEDGVLHINFQKASLAETWPAVLKGHANLNSAEHEQETQKILLERFQREVRDGRQRDACARTHEAATQGERAAVPSGTRSCDCHCAGLGWVGSGRVGPGRLRDAQWCCVIGGPGADCWGFPSFVFFLRLLSALLCV